MLKHVLLATGMMISLPAVAQTTPAPAGTQSVQPQAGRTPMPSAPATTTAPTGNAITAQTAPATPAPASPADPVVAQGSVEPASPQAASPAAPAEAAAAQPAASGGTQVAQIVDREFGVYDKDSDGKLSQAEFDTWMVALKTASDPATKADSPATKKWLGAAFVQADADKNSGVSKAELTGFLSQGQS